MSYYVRDRKTNFVYKILGEDLYCENCGGSLKSGIFPCDPGGNQVETTDELRKEELFVCANCGEIFKQVSYLEYLRAEYSQKAFQDLKFRMRDIMSEERIEEVDDKSVKLYLSSDHFIKWLDDEFHVHKMTYETLDGSVQVIVFDEYEDEDGLREVRLNAYLELAKVDMENWKSDGDVNFGKLIEYRVETIRTKDRIIITNEVFMNI